MPDKAAQAATIAQNVTYSASGVAMASSVFTFEHWIGIGSLSIGAISLILTIFFNLRREKIMKGEK